MILYHGTNTHRLESIQEHGLDPKAQKASSGDDYVYLTDSPEIAARFSGIGKDAMGMVRQGYMSSNEAKAKTGVVLKIKIPNPKKLAPDAIWKGFLKKLDGKKAYQRAYDQVLEDLDRGDKELDFYFDDALYKLCKNASKNKGQVDFLYSNPPEDFIEDARHLVADRFAKKDQQAVEKELAFFKMGKLYQYSDNIPPEAILEVIPAKKFLGQDEERPLGNENVSYASSKEKNIPEELSKLLREFTRSFEDYGIGHLATEVKNIIQEQYFEHRHFKMLHPYYVVKSSAKKKWNMQVFKNNYYAWLKRFTDTLNRIDRDKYPWLEKREVLEPFLKIKWDDVQIFGSSFLDSVKSKFK